MSAPHPVNPVNPERQAELAAGERVVVYEFCISLMAVTLRRHSRPVRLRPGQRAWLHGLPYCLVSLILGWWGLPWGVIHTPVTIASNLAGGCDITFQDRAAGCSGD